GDDLAQRAVGNAQAQLAGLGIDRRFAHQLLEDAAVEADLPRLLVGERALEPALILLHRPVVCGPVFLGGDFRPADRGDGRRSEAAQHVADAPDDEAYDDEPHHDGHDRLADDPLSRVAYRLEHLALIHLSFTARARLLAAPARFA